MNVEWRKSSASDDYGNCVELGALPDAVAIRDSKTPENGYLTLTPATFNRLLTTLKQLP
ncbi:DUF397 domain-containing protein [Actinomadura graeca]|uniref:DUF397 domain-containing protein n=1 Tax=Actinomadura graeca TaxID=2750812 RepID=A0ABX8QV81_9ACTN|nr:DUF397 domain-containing protein [Actinomadura graeca]QXJ22685.1 DUF397 domain-containing protein [Actinomadura graeca]